MGLIIIDKDEICFPKYVDLGYRKHSYGMFEFVCVHGLFLPLTAFPLMYTELELDKEGDFSHNADITIVGVLINWDLEVRVVSTLKGEVRTTHIPIGISHKYVFSNSQDYADIANAGLLLNQGMLGTIKLLSKIKGGIDKSLLVTTMPDIFDLVGALKKPDSGAEFREMAQRAAKIIETKFKHIDEGV